MKWTAWNHPLFVRSVLLSKNDLTFITCVFKLEIFDWLFLQLLQIILESPPKMDKPPNFLHPQITKKIDTLRDIKKQISKITNPNN